jgi:hypothetical protein
VTVFFGFAIYAPENPQNGFYVTACSSHRAVGSLLKRVHKSVLDEIDNTNARGRKAQSLERASLRLMLN